jgi:hypothetical protein
MLRPELLNVKAALKRELGQLVLDCSSWARTAPTKPGVARPTPERACSTARADREGATQSRLNKIISSLIYPSVTIRNWTTTKLLG